MKKKDTTNPLQKLEKQMDQFIFNSNKKLPTTTKKEPVITANAEKDNAVFIDRLSIKKQLIKLVKELKNKNSHFVV